LFRRRSPTRRCPTPPAVDGATATDREPTLTTTPAWPRAWTLGPSCLPGRRPRCHDRSGGGGGDPTATDSSESSPFPASIKPSRRNRTARNYYVAVGYTENRFRSFSDLMSGEKTTRKSVTSRRPRQSELSTHCFDALSALCPPSSAPLPFAARNTQSRCRRRVVDRRQPMRDIGRGPLNSDPALRPLSGRRAGRTPGSGACPGR